MPSTVPKTIRRCSGPPRFTLTTLHSPPPRERGACCRFIYVTELIAASDVMIGGTLMAKGLDG
jgi:hypothetical protein